MFKLEKLNVVRLVNSEQVRDKLISEGFKLIKDKKNVIPPAEESTPTDEDSAAEKIESVEGDKEVEKSEEYDFDNMEYLDLKEIAKEKGIVDYWKMKKDELIAALKEESGK